MQNYKNCRHYLKFNASSNWKHVVLAISGESVTSPDCERLSTISLNNSNVQELDTVFNEYMSLSTYTLNFLPPTSPINCSNVRLNIWKTLLSTFIVLQNILLHPFLMKNCLISSKESSIQPVLCSSFKVMQSAEEVFATWNSIISPVLISRSLKVFILSYNDYAAKLSCHGEINFRKEKSPQNRCQEEYNYLSLSRRCLAACWSDMKRENFDSYTQLLRENGVDRLYHITHRENWESIRLNGIYSSESIAKKNISAKFISDEVTHACDEKLGLNGYVHLTFSTNPVFLASALKANIIGNDYIVIEIALNVLNNDETIFCNMDSHYDDAMKGTNITSLSSINFSAATATDRSKIAFKDRRFCTAEILVPGHISSEHILNRIEIDNIINDIQKGDEFKRNLLVVMVDETTNMRLPITINGHSYPSISKYVEGAVNKLINEVALSYNSNGKIKNKYDIAVFGCGYTYGIAPLWNRQYSDDGGSFRSTHDLFDTYVKSLGERAPQWIQVGNDSFDPNYAKAFKKVKEFLQDWLDNNSIYCNPPIVLLLTSGLSVYDNPAAHAQGCTEIKQLQTLAGNVILWQIEYAPMSSTSVLCPEVNGDIGDLDPFAIFMSRHASVLPDIHKEYLRRVKPETEESLDYLCFGVNVDISDIKSLLLEDI